MKIEEKLLRKEKLPYFKTTSGRILVLSTFFSVVVATLAFRLYFGGDVVGICVDYSVKRKQDNPEWKKEHKTDENPNPVPDKDEMETAIENYIFSPCIILPIICSVTQLISLIILLKSKMKKPKWGKQLTMAILFLIAGTSCIYSVIRSLLNVISEKHYCVFWASIIFPACMMLSLGGHCFVCYIVFSTKAEYRIEENLKEIMNEEDMLSNRQDHDDFRASTGGGVPLAGAKTNECRSNSKGNKKNGW